MKALTLRPIALILSLFLSFQAAAQDPGFNHFFETSEGIEVIQSALKKEASEGFVDIEIPLEPIEVIPATMERQWDEIIVDPNFSIIVPATPQSEKQRRHYDQMSEAQKKGFHKRRLWILKRMTQALRLSHLSLGAGAITGDKIGHLKQRIPNSETLERLKGRLIHPIKYIGKHLNKTNPETADTASAEPQINQIKPSDIRGRNYQILAIMINSLNNRIWENASEVGVELAIGWQWEIFGGRSQLLGIRIGVDFDKHNLVFESYTSTEHYKSGIVFIPGIIAKALIYNRSPGGDRIVRGSSVYPPTPPIPGFGAGVEYSDNMVAAGWSGGIPSDLVPITMYTNTFKQTRRFHFEIGPSIILNLIKFKRNARAPADNTLQQINAALNQSQSPISEKTLSCQKALDQ